MKPSKRLIRAASLCLSVALALSGCTEPEQEAAQPVSRPVKLFTLGETEAARTLRFPGSVSAVKQSDMAFEVSGRIIDIPVTEGQRVAAGTVLARLDPRDYEAERDRARAERNAAQLEFNRYEAAFKARAVAAQDVDRTRRNLAVAEANLRQATKAIEDTVLRAPFVGRVARKLVEDFANVQTKQPVLILQSDDAMEMRIQVPEALWVRSQRVDSAADIEEINSQIRVVLSSLPDQPIAARITAFASMADPVTRTFRVTVGFEPPAGSSVSPGMTGHVAYSLPAGAASAGLHVPADAVVAAPDNTPFVWLFDAQSGTVRQRPVTLGELSGDRVLVTSGLAVGDRIAVSGVHTLSDGFPVHALED
ncbi:efflux RND transporter periplasmic adaptor subunit [Pseudomonas aeruginosa]|uniref:efflux RND transporter periplasmic adaptor subunit n=1 Tax=Pseudomonas aeruginosa TaxID=287 RepID=UPI000F6F76F0|nr:efflux RND transporter periplasmic adaptor subunit [Pseudomonas aeruginosa]VDK92312.1 oqxA_1_EU370913 [Pseudomonas aeruginosa]VDL10090.1 oqxA_1_EU370913 [Pseudomonas aeruginosa]VDL13637.1 oqxA_1_EU370913 [Pseudomonas aeruginosa]VDL48945.1 oqxA_1_EU370913 [Pseudomonas aeruginosa]VDL52096.1 oqxA_1_EU370913 [Pseudomonas aeruginosa]